MGVEKKVKTTTNSRTTSPSRRSCSSHSTLQVWTTLTMDPANLKAQFQPQLEEPRLLSFPHLPDDAKYEDGTPILNKYSSTLTRGHDFPGAQAMLYAAGVPNEKMMKTAPQVGIASVWWEGNPCK
jgi:dihydroxy-acid dehydratase